MNDLMNNYSDVLSFRDDNLMNIYYSVTGHMIIQEIKSF